MKITEIILENFAAIHNAMNAKKIRIDFTKAKNNICLLIGPNGSGKTTILSLLTPFADLGNLDIRNGNNLILKNRDGYKEIHIAKDEDMYVIKHYYTHHKDKNHSVKSYIEKNGVELNVNGNVTSFKEFVSLELNIEPDYLKLIRLGKNVTSLIDMTATERKNYMGKLMDELDIYLEHYKDLNQKIRQIEDMMSHTIHRLDRLEIGDEDTFNKELEGLRDDINILEKLFVDESNRVAVARSTIDSIPHTDTLAEDFKRVTKKYDKMVQVLGDGNASIDDITELSSTINDIERRLDSLKNEEKTNVLLIENTLEHLDSEQETLRLHNVELQKTLESEDEIRRLDDNLSDMRKRMNTLESHLGDFKPGYKKEEFDEFVVFLKNVQQVLTRTYGFGKRPIKKVIELMKKNKNVMNYINSHLLSLDDDEGDKGSLFISKISKELLFDRENKPVTIECDKECKAKELFKQIQAIVMNAEVDDKKEDAAFYKDMEYVYQNLIAVLPRFREFEFIIKLLPDTLQESFKLNTMYKNICDCEFIYDDKELNNLMSLVTEYYNYEDLVARFAEAESHRSLYANLGQGLNYEALIKASEYKINEDRRKITDLKDRNIEIISEVKELNNTLEVTRDTKEALEEIDSVKKELDELTKNHEIYIKAMEDLQTSELEVTKLKVQIDNMKEKLSKKEQDKYMYKTLSKDLKKFNKIFDEMTFTKKAFSSKEGMPLRLIKNYLGDVVDIANELLDIAYDGRVSLEEFDIKPSEFNMPFYINGVRLDDVKYSSQGELSFLSLALSFALASQSLRKYNIMLLDEVDGVLDTSNREKFIKILENQIERIGCEQCFLITHNVMFSAYPVDIINLHKTTVEDYPLATFIEVEKDRR